MKRVIVHIDSVVLKGFRYEERHALVEGLRTELERLLAEPEMGQQLASGGSVSRLKPVGIKAGAHTKPSQIGIRAARSIVKGISHESQHASTDPQR